MDILDTNFIAKSNRKLNKENSLTSENRNLFKFEDKCLI